jgi:molybdate transport system permease protein
VPLELQIEKELPEFTLDAAFRADDDAPLAILGPSGAGKTMLLRCIAGLERPDRGRIALDGHVVFDSAQKIDVPARSRRIGLLFQHFALFPHRTVGENLSFGLRHLPAGERESRIAQVTRQTHIAGLEHRYPRELSGGEQQRVALARALAIDPEALMLDEPLSSLDTHLRSQIESQLQQTFSEYRRPSLLVTHSMEEAYRLCRRLVVLSRGRVAALGDMEEIFRRPPNAGVARLTGCKNISRVRPLANGSVEAIDWGCRLRIADAAVGVHAYAGIRAHHIDFVESPAAGTAGENVFPCWLVRSSETPFRITLFLTLREPRSGSAGGVANSKQTTAADFDLQAEVFKEKWERFRNQAQPWQVRLPSSALFLMPE